MFNFVPAFAWIYFNWSTNPKVIRRSLFEIRDGDFEYAIPIINSFVEYTTYGFG